MRLDYFSTPSAFRIRIDEVLDSPVIAAVNAVGGYSPGPASRCDLADGRKVFIKACSDELSAFATPMHRQEAKVLADFPDHIPAPSFIAGVTFEDWFGLIVEHVDGETPPEPLTATVATEVLEFMVDFAEVMQVCPPSVQNRIGASPFEKANYWAWRQIRDSSMSDGLGEWSRANLARLIELEDDWIDAAHGEALIHGDLRTDNMVLRGARGVAVDWPGASRGAPWIDFLGLLPAMHLNGGPAPWDVFDSHPIGAAADRDAVTCYVAMISGYFVRQSLLPPPPNLEHLRRFQADQGAITTAWLRHRLEDPA